MKANSCNVFTPFCVSPITKAWRVLRLQLEETASSCGGYCEMYWICRRWQPTRGDPPALGLGDVLANNS